MPVVRIELERFSRMVGAGRREVLDRLPYVGLDIEGVDGNSVRVEYSPNRPDFGTDYGISRALRGLLGRQVGLPVYAVRSPKFDVKVDRGLSHIRPLIACCVATGMKLDDEDVRQLVSLQEDLHNGIGRRRRRMAAGLHDMRAVSQPLEFKGVPERFAFVPLEGKREMSIKRILSETEAGRAYSSALPKTDTYPVILDSTGTVLSLPPVTNGLKTRLTSRTKSVLVEVTGTDRSAVDDALAILSTTLGEMGGTLGAVRIRGPGGSRTTPDLSPSKTPLDARLVRDVTGLELKMSEIRRCLARSRLGLQGNAVLVPRYRIDVLHPVDIAEEVALGYGVDRLTPVYPPSSRPGTFNPFEEFLERVADTMAESGMIEIMTYELMDRASLFSRFGREGDDAVSVESPKSIDHSILRDALLPPMMAALGRNVKEEYPQRVFEMGRVYAMKGTLVEESLHLGCLVAHAQASYTEAKMYLDSVLRTLAGLGASTVPVKHWAFSEGRAASVYCGREAVGFVGEVKPEAIEAFGLTVPVAGFEIDLSRISKQLK